MSKHITLLLNLGSPDSTSIPDIKKYLAQFLMDKYVIDAPWPIRAGIVYGSILPKRPPNTAEAYEAIWTKNGSPLIHISKETQRLVQAQTRAPIYLAMRYGNPSIKNELKKIKTENPDLESITAIPLYPQYAMSTTKTVMEEVTTWGEKLNLECTVHFKEPFYKDPDYISALANSATQLKNADYILFSYHGLPERHLRKTDPTKQHCLKENCCEIQSEAWNTCYRHQCFETTKALLKKLNLNTPHTIAFQSRLGNDPWLTPNTEDELIRLAKEGQTSIHVICPSFVTDCLETLEEINIGGKETFLKNGGKSFTYVPCLNTNKEWIEMLSEIATMS